VKLEVRSKTDESIDQIAGRARQISDAIHRLRYLHRMVMLVPVTPRWREWLQSPMIVAIVAAAIIGMALLVGGQLRR
jgi:hypothetical protein